jgi:hypothetical protein
MRHLVAAIAFAAFAQGAHAQEKKPTPAQMEQQKRMMNCNVQASGIPAAERQKFMTDCMKGPAASPEQKAHQERMRTCNRRAADKGLKGNERMKFMSSCFKS